MSSVIAYHGSNFEINDFDLSYCNQGHDQYGSGFYFTTDFDDARAHGKFVHEALLELQKPLSPTDCDPLPKEKVLKILERSPILKDVLWNWGDLDRENIRVVLRRAASCYVSESGREPLIKVLYKLANDFFPDAEHLNAFNLAVMENTKFDSVKIKLDNYDHYVAWFPSQVNIQKIIKEELKNENHFKI